MVNSMLKILPSSRPDCSIILKKIEKIGKTPTSKHLDQPTPEHNLLGTIAMPKDLRHLEDLLPESKYDNPRLLNRNGSMPKPNSQPDLKDSKKL